MNALTIRQWHGYVGMFIAPSVLFFSLTGAIQLFSLHEAHGNYHPAPIIEKLGKLHKDQVFEQKNPVPEADHDEPDVAPKALPGAVPADDAGASHEHHHERKLQPVTVYLLKWFCLFVALGLAVSTSFGIWMALTQSRRRRLHVILLAIGIVVPLLLIVA